MAPQGPPPVSIGGRGTEYWSFVPQPDRTLLKRIATHPRLPRGFRAAISVARTLRVFGPLAALKIGVAWRRPGRYTVRVKPLGHDVEIRGATSDAKVLLDTFREAYDFPAFLESPRVVWDLGANIGLTLARCASLYPDAEIHGVELDPDSAELARRNTRPYGDRVSVVTGAVWVEDGEVTYRLDEGSECGAAVRPGAGLRAPAYALDSLITGPVDFVKMDIEGAEREVLKRNTGWSRHVKSMYVEFHNYPAEECLADLRALGFDAHRDGRHWAAAVGVRSGQ